MWDFKGIGVMSLEPGSICGDWGMVGSVESFDTPWRGIMGVSRGEDTLVPVTSGGTAGIITGEETTIVEGDWLLEVSEPERRRPMEPLISIWAGATPR